jgi:Ca-activated chloride channel family protein
MALARPRVSYRTAVTEGSMMLVLDHSGSMAANDVQPTRLAAAVSAADGFIRQLPSTVRLGAVAFSTVPDAVQAPVTDHAAARSIVDAQQANGGTDTGGALALALQLLHGSDRHHPPSAVVLLSDGAANRGPDPVTVATQARSDRIPIYTVALGTATGILNTGPLSPPVSVPPDPELMAQIARTSAARAFTAETSDQLSSIYQNLANHLGTVKRSRDITAEFAIAAAALLLGAAALSVRFAGRLP